MKIEATETMMAAKSMTAETVATETMLAETVATESMAETSEANASETVVGTVMDSVTFYFNWDFYGFHNRNGYLLGDVDWDLDCLDCLDCLWNWNVLDDRHFDWNFNRERL